MLTSRQLYVLTLVFALLTVLALALDLPVATFWRTTSRHGDLFRALMLLEFFGHGLGVIWILATVVTLDPQGWSKLPRLLTCTYGAGLVASISKFLVIRSRPRGMTNATSVWDTFGGWSTFEHFLSWPLKVDLRSFPSGHVAFATGLAIGLGSIYPRGRVLFMTLALLSGIQRTAIAAHFTSDVFAGAAIGCLWCAICLQIRPAPATNSICDLPVSTASTEAK